MGLGMPNFITKGYNSFKTRCNNIKDTYNGLKDSLAMAKMMLNLTKNIDINKMNNNPGEVLNQMKTADGIPETMKLVLSSLDSNTINKMGAMMHEHFAKLDGPGNSNKTLDPSLDTDDTSDKNVYEHLRNPFQKSKSSGSNMGSNDSKAPSSSHEQARPPDNNSQPKAKQKNRSSSIPKTNAKTEDNRNSDDPEYIPSSAYSEIMSIDDSKNNSNQSTEEQNIHEQRESKGSNKKHTDKRKEDPQPGLNNPMKRILVGEMERRFGKRWKDYIPPSITDPKFAQNAPDLGLGLGKEGNAAMFSNMSKIFKDIL